MNRLFRYLMMSVLALCTAGFVSCGDDDDNDDAKSNDVTNGLTGSKTSPAEISGNKWVINWQNSKAYAEMNGIKGETVMEENGINGLFLTEMKFYSDGTMDCAIDTLKSKGTYSIDGFEFTSTYDILLHVQNWDSEGNTQESYKRKSFTFKKGADLSDCLYGELETSEAPMTYNITKYEISKTDNKLFVTMVVNMGYNLDVDTGDMGEWGGMFDNLMKSKKEISYYLVYDKK